MNKPPKHIIRFFRWFCRPDYVDDIEGDLLERYETRVKSDGIKRAKINLWLEVLKLMRPSLLKRVHHGQKLNHFGMFKHNLTIGWRNILRKKSFSLINVVGLSTGAAVCLLTLIFYRYETSFDHHHQQADQTYRVVQHTILPDDELFWSTTAYPLAAALRNDFPDFANVTQTSGPTNRLFSAQNELNEKVLFEEQHVLFADQYYPQVFDFEWVVGQPEKALESPNSLIITERIAKKCFGEQYNPSAVLGKILMLNDKDQLIVTGVIKDHRPNSNLKANMIVSYEFFKKHNPYPTSNWRGNYQGTTFVVLKNSDQPKNIVSKINGWKNKYLDPKDHERISYQLQPLKEIHTETKYGTTPQGYQIQKSTLNTSLVVAFFILIIAIINFTNLITANASVRAKEVGIRKAIGGGKGNIFSQFVLENMLIAFISFSVAILLAYWSLAYINDFLSIINLQLVLEISDLVLALAFCFVIALVATIYPSIVLSSFQPIKALNGRNASDRKGSSFRKGLTFFQFAIVQVFVISAIIIGVQLRYFNSKSLGFTSEKIVSVPLPTFEKKDVFTNELKSLGIQQVSVASGPPMAVENFSLGTRYRLPHQQDGEGLSAEMKITDLAYLELFDIPLLAGRNFLENKPQFDEFIINRKLASSLGWTPEESIGKRLAINEGEATIVGVVEDFHNQSLQHDITPLVLMNWHAFQWDVLFNIDSYQEMAAIEDLWKKQFPNKIYKHQFVNDSMEKEYIIEKLIFTGFNFFSILVIIIGCLGLFGLISFLTLQKTKEIGIRKVLGASIVEILVLFNKKYSGLILLGFLVAIPIVYYTMNLWLSSFTYRVPMSAWMFLSGGAITFLLGSSLAMLKSYQAATVNPVVSLKDE